MRETFSSVPTARRLSLRSSLLALLLPSVGHTGARVRPRTPNTPACSHIYPFQRGSRVYIHCTRAIPPPKNCSCRGGVGRAATPLDRLRCCEAQQRAISGRPYPSEDEEGGVLLSKRVCVRCVANVRTYEWVYVATCARVRCVVEPLIARGKGEKRRFLCSLFAETRDTGILESVKGAVCVRSNRRKKVVSILRWIFFFVNFSVVQCTVVVRGVASRFSVPCSLRGFRLNRIQHPLIDFSRNGTHETLLRWKETLIREFAGRSFFFPRNGLQFQRNALARETFRDKTEGRNSGRET